MTAASLEIEVCPEGHTVTLYLEGEIDAVSVGGLRACLEEVDSRWDTVVVDMAKVSFVDSSGVAALIRAHRRLQPDAVLEVRRTTTVRRILEIIGVGELFKVS